jgi:rubrerythrin
MFFNEIEAAKIAENMETNGLAFYRHAAEKTKNPKVREVFEQLIEDEKKHLATFEELEETLQARRSDGAGYADDPELGAYIDRLLQTQVFCEKCAVTNMLAQTLDDCAALALAMQAERDAVVFYREMLDFVDSKEAREAFEWILREERTHLQTLGDRGAACGLKP